MRVYVLMATYNAKYSSGGTIAHATVERMAKNVNTVVITVGEKRETSFYEGVRVETFPISIDKRVALLFSRIGLQEDYLSKWGEQVSHFLEYEEKANEKDVLLCTTVGELGTLHVGNEIKKRCGSKFYIHFHDPIKHVSVNGEKYGHYPLPYASKEKFEEIYVRNSDKIFTCCETFLQYLVKKYPGIESKSKNYYFGWQKLGDEIDSVGIKQYSTSQIVIAYGGIFNWPQGPEILGLASCKSKGVCVEYIGAWGKYKKVSKMRSENVKLIERMSRDKYVAHLRGDVDVGFVSLSRSYFSACIPAKIYEYIFAGIPILAALPDGAAKDIINDNGYGIAVDYDVAQLNSAIEEMKTKDLNIYRQNILRDREKWSFDNTMLGFLDEVRN